MSHRRFYLNLYVIIPVIFAGVAILSAVGTFQLSEYLRQREVLLSMPVFWWTAASGLIGYCCGLLILSVLLKPVQKFYDKAQKLRVIQEPVSSTVEVAGRANELHRFDRLFNHVVDVLSTVDARRRFPEIIGESRAIRGVLSQIEKVAPTDSTVLLFGESGTGKELVANSIFRHSLRGEAAYVTLNCVAIPEGLLESELFGHEKGAFTGAIAAKKGKFEIAHNGTLFLDEIGDMALDTQAKILRVLQEREFERVGGNKAIRVDVRFIAASNRNLEQMVQEGRFREDLYYRLNVFSLRLPPLRERREDIPLLVEHFIQKSPKSVQVSIGAMQALRAYSWPGNVRELQNVVERAAVLTEQGVIEPHHLPSFFFSDAPMEMVRREENETGTLDDHIQGIEKSMIVEALRKTGGIQVRAAELLGISQRSLWHRIKKHSVDVQPFKELQNLEQ